MKKIIFLIAMPFIIINSTMAQNGKTEQSDTIVSAEKSETVSSLVIAQGETIQKVLNSLYKSKGKINVVENYETLIKPKIAKCLYTDMMQTGIKVQENALQGKFKKIKLKFEKPSDNTFKVSGKTKRAYKRAYKKFKKEFVETRKSKTLKEILDEKNLAKKVDKVAKIMKRKFGKDIRKISK